MFARLGWEGSTWPLTKQAQVPQALLRRAPLSGLPAALPVRGTLPTLSYGQGQPQQSKAEKGKAPEKVPR